MNTDGAETGDLIEIVSTNPGSSSGSDLEEARAKHLRESENLPDSDCKTTVIKYLPNGALMTTAKGVADASPNWIDRAETKGEIYETIEEIRRATEE